MNSPWWVVATAVGVLAAGSVAALTRGTRVGRWLAPAMGVLVLLGLAVVGNWVAFGPGPRACTGGVSYFFLSGARAAGDTECRVAFGLGAVMLNATLVMATFSGVARLAGRPPWAATLERLGQGIFLVAVFPLVLVALVALGLTEGGRWVARRIGGAGSGG